MARTKPMTASGAGALIAHIQRERERLGEDRTQDGRRRAQELGGSIMKIATIAFA
jgi:hypothetical protein